MVPKTRSVHTRYSKYAFLNTRVTAETRGNKLRTICFAEIRQEGCFTFRSLEALIYPKLIANSNLSGRALIPLSPCSQQQQIDSLIQGLDQEMLKILFPSASLACGVDALSYGSVEAANSNGEYQ